MHGLGVLGDLPPSPSLLLPAAPSVPDPALIAGWLVLSLYKRPWLASRYPISPAERRPDGRTLGGMMKSALRAQRPR